MRRTIQPEPAFAPDFNSSNAHNFPTAFLLSELSNQGEQDVTHSRVEITDTSRHLADVSISALSPLLFPRFSSEQPGCATPAPDLLCAGDIDLQIPLRYTHIYNLHSISVRADTPQSITYVCRSTQAEPPIAARPKLPRSLRANA